MTFLGLLKGGEDLRSQWVEEDTMRCILTALTYENRLAVLVSLRHGLRIGDVLNLKTRDVMKGDFTIREQKTGKRKRVHLGCDLQRDLLAIGGKVYVFEGRNSPLRHRTRQAVFKDLRRVSTAFRLKGISPHSARKVYAVRRYRDCGDIRKVQRLLNHSNEAVTMLYAMADELSQNYHKTDKQLSQ